MTWGKLGLKLKRIVMIALISIGHLVPKAKIKRVVGIVDGAIIR